LYSVISASLAVFDISKAVENGVEITPVHENTSGIIRLVFLASVFCLLDVHGLIESCSLAILNRSNALSNRDRRRRYPSSTRSSVKPYICTAWLRFNPTAHPSHYFIRSFHRHHLV
jgi:hypothetical protein